MTDDSGSITPEIIDAAAHEYDAPPTTSRRTVRPTGMRVALATVSSVVLLAGGAACSADDPPSSAPTATSTTSRPATSEPTPSPTPAPTPTPSPSPSDEPPRLAYAAAGVIHGADGTTTRVPDGREVVGLASFGSSTYLVATSRARGGLLDEGFLRRGRLPDTVCTPSPAVVSPGERAYAYLTTPCAADGDGPTTLTFQDIGDSLPRSVVVPDDALLAGFVGRGEIAFTVPGDGVHVAHLGGYDAPDPAPVPTRVPGALRVTATSTGLLAGDLTHGDGGVVTPSGRVLWRREALGAGPFSPDGRRLVTYGADTGSITDAATGTPTGAGPIGSGDGYPIYGALVWEDDRHLLVVLTYRHERHLARVGLDGTVSGPLERTPLPAEGPIVWETAP